MTIPMPGVNTTPQLVQPQGPGGIEQLLQVLQFRTLAKQKDREFAAAQAADAFKLDQNRQQGELQAELLPMLAKPGVMGGTIPAIPGVTMTGTTIQRDMASERLQRAFTGRPGTVIEGVARTSANAIQQAIARDQKQFEDAAAARAPKATAAKPLQLVAGADGFAYNYDTTLGGVTQTLDASGKPFKLKDPKAEGNGMRVLPGLLTKGGQLHYQVADKNGNVALRAMPEGFMRAGIVGEGAYKAMSRYAQGVEGFSSLAAEGFPSISTAVVDGIATLAKGKGANTTMGQYIATLALDDPQTRALTAWATIIAGKLYKDSGAAVTIGEFNRFFSNLIQTDRDSDKTKKLKRRILLRNLGADKMQAQVAGLVQQSTGEGSGLTDLPDFEDIVAQSEAAGVNTIDDPNELDVIR